MNKVLITILILLPFLTSAQIVSDAKVWSGLSITKKIVDFEFSFSEELRMDENASHIYKVFSEFGAQYKIIKGLYVAVNYRFNRDNDYETVNYDIRHRIDFGLTYKRKLNDFRFAFRSKIQTKNALSAENKPTFSRNKISIKYKLKNNLSSFISYEFYYQFNEEKVINRNRFYLGSSYKINKHNAVKLFYMYENRFNVKTLKHNHIYGLSYSIEI